MATTPHIIFDDFLRELKKEGFSLSQHDYIEFTAIFDQFGGNKESFKYYLAPIVCRNEEEQKKFYRIYDRFYLKSMEGPRGMLTWPSRPSSGKRWSLGALLRNFLFWVCFFLLTGVGVRLRQMLRRPPPAMTIVAPPSDTIPSKPEAAKKTRPGHVFVAKAMKPHSDSGEVKSRVEPIGEPIEKQNTVHSTAFAWLVVLGLACLGASASFFPQKRSKYLPETDLDTRPGDNAPVDLPFAGKDQLIQKLPALAGLSGELIRPVPTGIYQLDVKKTIVESVNHYGLLVPVYKNMESRPEYLVLINRRNALYNALFRCLTQGFIEDAVHINYYYFDDVSAFFSEGSEMPVRLYQLRERHHDAKVIILGDWQPLAGSALTNDLRVLWPEMEYILQLAKTLHEDDPDTGYSHSGGVCIPDGGHPHLEDMDALQEYLEDEDLFQWVCAIAVYPTVKWEVILSIGSAVLGESRALYKLNIANLLKIAAIGWLHDKTIPHAIRVALLKRLHIHSEIIARQKILELLKESDDLLDVDSISYKDKLMLQYTQSFILYANDVKKNKEHEQDAKKFLSIWDKQEVPDLATVIYLKNQDKQWDTPVRSIDDPSRSVAVNKFMNELLALRVISDPSIRRYFRNAGISCFALLILLFLFKDSIQEWGINKTLGLVDRDYIGNAIVVRIPVTDCLRKRVSDGRLTVTLNNYDNNRYTRTFSIVDRDSLTAVFEEVTMSGKPPEKATFFLVLNNDLAIPCTYKEYYPGYHLVLQGVDCSNDLHPNAPHYETTHPDVLVQ